MLPKGHPKRRINSVTQVTPVTLLEKDIEIQQKKQKGLLSTFLSLLFADIAKRTCKPFDMFTLTEISDLPLIVCEKICAVLTSTSIIDEQAFISGMKKLFFSKSSTRLIFLCQICDFTHKNLIKKNDVKVLLLHLHMHTLNHLYEKDLLEIIDAFFGKKNNYPISSFINKTTTINYDIAYIFFLFFDKYSFGNYEQFDLFNREVFKGKFDLEEFVVKNYNLNLLSSKAIEYGKRIMNAKIEKEAFDEDNDESLAVMESFENEVSKTIGEMKMFKSDSGKGTTFSTTNTTNDFKIKSKLSKDPDFGCPYTEDRKNEEEFDKKDRVYKTLDLLRKTRGFCDSGMEESHARRSSPTKRTYDQPAPTMRESSNYQNYNEIICYKQTKKAKEPVVVKLIHINSLLFYFKLTQTKGRANLPGLQTTLEKNFKPETVNSVSNSYTYNKFKLKRIILTKRLYPTIIKYPNKSSFQLQLSFSMHNTQSVLNFYSENEGLITTFAKKLSLSQHQCGRNITDIYEMGHEIGKGKFGTVSTATHRLTNHLVAIKVVSKIEVSNEESYNTFKWENDIFKFLQSASINCENIIRCYEYFETPNYLYYVTEYVPDGNLRDYVMKFTNAGMKVRESNVNEICKQMLNGIAYLHNYGIIHRDIKHTNTLIEKYNFSSSCKSHNVVTQKHSIKIKIIDFGLSKVMGYDDSAIEPYGSLSFKAPELVMENSYSFGVDIWAFGITIYYVVFQKFPVSANDKVSLKEKIVNENYWGTFIQKGMTIAGSGSKMIFQCLDKDPKKRPKAEALLYECQ